VFDDGRKNLINISRARARPRDGFQSESGPFDSAFDYGGYLWRNEAGLSGTAQTAIEENPAGRILGAYSHNFQKDPLSRRARRCLAQTFAKGGRDIKGNTDNWFELCQSGTARQVKIAGLRSCGPQTQSRRRNFARRKLPPRTRARLFIGRRPRPFPFPP